MYPWRAFPSNSSRATCSRDEYPQRTCRPGKAWKYVAGNSGIVQLVLLGVEDRRHVPNWILRLANDRVGWDNYPWGLYVWPTLYKHLRDANVKRQLPVERLVPDEIEARSRWYCTGEILESPLSPHFIFGEQEFTIPKLGQEALDLAIRLKALDEGYQFLTDRSAPQRHAAIALAVQNEFPLAYHAEVRCLKLAETYSAWLHEWYYKTSPNCRVAGKIQLFVSHHQIDLSTVLILNPMGTLEEAFAVVFI
ncbi:hypothetical protein Tco_0242725 [Tanacetum coccineum]